MYQPASKCPCFFSSYFFQTSIGPPMCSARDCVPLSRIIRISLSSESFLSGNKRGTASRHLIWPKFILNYKSTHSPCLLVCPLCPFSHEPPQIFLLSIPSKQLLGTSPTNPHIAKPFLNAHLRELGWLMCPSFWKSCQYLAFSIPHSSCLTGLPISLPASNLSKTLNTTNLRRWWLWS